MDRDYFVVDAFTSEAFAGNPAAVVLDAVGLTGIQMQAIAAEFNLSETTFVLSPECTVGAGTNTDEPAYRFRWFTPQVEVDLCGHATVAAIQALMDSDRLKFPDAVGSKQIQIETNGGTLTAFAEKMPGTSSGIMVWLDLPDAHLRSIELPIDRIAGAVGVSVSALDPDLAVEVTQDGDLLVFIHDFRSLMNARPDFQILEKLLQDEGLRGLSLATVRTLTPSITLQSRFFAPSLGVNEDPVTGSVHGPLAAYLLKHELIALTGGLAGASCVQGVPGGRTGLIHVLVQPGENGGFSTRIGGSAVSVMRGCLLNL